MSTFDKNQNLQFISCVKCGGDMPILRKIKYGYNSCIKCSTVQQVGGVQIVNHKSGNEIQIVSKDLAEKINELSDRPGYGISLGMQKNKGKKWKRF
jgi:hypothetical protein